MLNFEGLIGNTSFGILLVTMLLYWFRAAFFMTNQFIGDRLKQVGFWGVFSANILLACLLTFRWFTSHHFPLSNLYESLIFLAWGISLIQLFIEKETKNNLIGVIFSPIILFIDAFATLTLPSQMQESAPLIPALKSNWLMMHVSIMMLSYATLIAGSLIAIAFLIVSRNQEDKLQTNTLVQEQSLGRTLDDLSYRTLGVGFPLLTLGILSGAIWANEAWGSYWSWDPKETWALITWLIFAAYIHARLTKGWVGEKAALLGSIGFIIVWICYLGVNFLGQGLHSYGFLS